MTKVHFLDSLSELHVPNSFELLRLRLNVLLVLFLSHVYGSSTLHLSTYLVYWVFISFLGQFVRVQGSFKTNIQSQIQDSFLDRFIIINNQPNKLNQQQSIVICKIDSQNIFNAKRQMHKSSPIRIINLFTRQYAMFSENQSATTKSYRMPVRQAQNLFKPKKPVQFYQGRTLIYFNKQGLLTPTLLTAHLTIPMIYIGYLIKNNPWYLTFPAALPIMFFVEVFLFMRMITHKKDNKYQIERIYLFEDGQTLEVWLANKIRRRLKNTQDQLYMPIKNMKTPPRGDNELPLKGTLFPEQFNKIIWPMPWEYGWYKYDDNRENYIIPKKFQYANMQILVLFEDYRSQIPALKGIEIDVSECPKTPIPVEQLKKMPSMEDVLKEVEQKKKYDYEWERVHGPIKYSIEQDI